VVVQEIEDEAENDDVQQAGVEAVAEDVVVPEGCA
jgi:hypothetical protein